MRLTWKQIGFGVLAWSALAQATELTLHLKSTQAISRQTMQYECDAQGTAMSLPASVLPVEYMNGAGNSVAIIPGHGISTTFANVHAGSGARYAASDFIWWDAAGRSTTFSSDSLAGRMSSLCHRVTTR